MSKALAKNLALFSLAAILLAAPLVSLAQAGFGQGAQAAPSTTGFGAGTQSAGNSTGFGAGAQAAPSTTGAGAKKPDTTQCGESWVFCGLTKAFNFVSIQIGYGISYLASFLITIAAAIIQVIINAGSTVLSNQLVTTGFRITLDIANLGFVLAIIVIAFTTMLRLSGYETKQMLKNLILAAVLVNFSFLIAGVVIDFANVFGNFFLNAATPGDITKFGDNLANALSVQKLLDIVPGPGSSLSGGFLSFGASYLAMFTSLAATLIFSLFIVITFFAIAIMLVVRYVWIVILLILMPLAWLSLTVPKLSHYYKEWWSNFIQWNIFYPAVTLFLYLGVATSQEVGKSVLSGNVLAGTALQGASKLTGLATSTLSVLLQIFVQVFLMLGGLITANKLKITGADGAMNLLKGMKEGFIGKTRSMKDIGKSIGGRAVRTLARAPVIGTFASPVLSTFSPQFKKERGLAAAARTRAEETSGAGIAAAVKSGDLTLEEVRRRAGSRWKTFVPGFGRQKANAIMALAALESGGEYKVGQPAQAGAGWQAPTASDKERSLIKKARKKIEKREEVEKKQKGPSLEERLKKLEEQGEK